MPHEAFCVTYVLYNWISQFDRPIYHLCCNIVVIYIKLWHFCCCYCLCVYTG